MSYSYVITVVLAPVVFYPLINDFIQKGDASNFPFWAFGVRVE